MEPPRGAEGRGGALTEISSPKAPGDKSGETKPGDLPAREVSPVPEHSLETFLSVAEDASDHQHELYFIQDDDDRQKIIHQCRKWYGPASGKQVFHIDSPEALETQGLLSTVSCSQGKTRVDQGRLFGEQPLTIVLDLTQMRPGQIASLNDLLQIPHKYQGKAIGPDIRMVVLMDDATGEQVGPDCWRRLKNYSLKETDSIQETVLSNRALVARRIHKLPEKGLPPSATRTVDFFGGDDWKARLFGSLAVDQRGKVMFRKGILADLNTGEHLVLRDAPWSDADFEAAMATALREGGFEANNQWVELPAGITLFRTRTPSENIQQKIRDCTSELKPDADFIRLNQTSYEFLQVSVHVNHEGLLVSFNPLQEWLGQCRQIRVTEPLSDQQWRLFFHYYEQIPEQERPGLVFDAPDIDESGFRQSIFEEDTDEQEAPACFHYHFDADSTDHWDSLFTTVALSKESGRFEQKNTGMLSALAAPGNKKITFHGVKPGSGLARKLQTLNESPPYIFAHGHKLPVNLSDGQVHYIPASKVRKVNWNDAFIIAIKIAEEGRNDSGLDSKTIDRWSYFFDKIGALYNMLFDLPASSEHPFHARPPWSFESLSRKAREIFKSTPPHLIHYRVQQSFLKFMAEPYRNDPNLYSFLHAQMQRLGLKFKSCHFFQTGDDISISDIQGRLRPWSLKKHHTQLPPLANRDGLQAWLQSHPRPDRNDLRRHFWPLVKHCPVQEFPSLPTTYTASPDDACIDLLAAYLCGAIRDSDEQKRLAGQLNLKEEPYNKLRYYSERRLKLLNHYHRLITPFSRWNMLSQSGLVKSHRLFAEIITTLEDPTLDDVGKIRKVAAALKALRDPAPPLRGYEDFVLTLVFGSKHAYLRQQVRVERLKRTAARVPIIYLEGKSGTGKGWLAEVLTNRTLTLGAHTTQEDLFGRQVTRKTPGGVEYSQFEPGPLLRWLTDESGEASALILKQAHRVRKGVLAPLAGLASENPGISVFGETYYIEKWKTLLLTGDEGGGGENSLDPALKHIACTIHCRPIDPQVLALSIIHPGLPESWNDSLKQHACGCILSLFKQYQSIMPAETLTVRDIRDVLANINHSLRIAAPGQPPSEEALNALVDDAFQQCLDGSVPEHKREQLAALRYWSQQAFPQDSSILEGKKQAFSEFHQALCRRNPDIDLEATPVVKLVEQYWLCLNKGDEGRTAVIVEGPAGWGKDLILDRVLALWHDQLPGLRRINYVHINAGLSQWDTLKDSVSEAMEDGKIIAVSELNLIPPADLESLLNDVSSGFATPGFRLIATVNPASFGGRESLSPALKSRFTQIKLNPMNHTDLKGIISRRAGQPAADWLSDRFLCLSRILQERQLSLRPSMADLVNITDRIKSNPKTRWSSLFSESFALELRQAGLTIEELEKLIQSPPVRPSEEHPLLESINRIKWLKHPVAVKAGPTTEYDVEAHCLTLSNVLSMEEQLEQAKVFLRQHGIILTIPDAMVWFQASLLRSGGSHLPQKKLERTVYKPGRNQSRPGAKTLPVESERPLMPLVITPDGKDTSSSNTTVSKHTIFSDRRYRPKDYRLGIYALDSRHHSNIHFRLMKPASSDISDEPAAHPWPENNQLTTGEVLGGSKVWLSQSWQPLPGLSSLDELRAIQVRNNPDLEIVTARNQATGQLLVRLSAGEPQSVQLDFILRPNTGRFGVPSEIKTAEFPLLGASTRQLLDRHVFNPETDNSGFRALGKIREMPENTDKVMALIEWCRSFKTGPKISGEGLDLLLKLMALKQGACRHRAEIFVLIASYFNIPARVVRNDCHQYAEYSPDLGDSWYRAELGGAPATIKTSSEDILTPSYWYSPSSLWKSAAGMTASVLSGGLRYLTGSTPQREEQPSGASSDVPAKAMSARQASSTVSAQSPKPETDQDPDLRMKKAGKRSHRRPGGSSTTPRPLPVPDDEMLQTWSSMLRKIEETKSVSPEAVSSMQQWLQDKVAPSPQQHFSDTDIRWLRERTMSFLLSNAYLEALSENAELVSLIRTVLALKPDQPENRQYLIKLLTRLHQSPSFHHSALCDAAKSLLDSEGHYLQDADTLDLWEAMKVHSSL